MKYPQRYRASGWFGESYRHKLAAKGISTNYFSKKPRRYFVNQRAKGNRMPALVAVGHAQGFEDATLQGNERLLRRIADTAPVAKNWSEERKEYEIVRALNNLDEELTQQLPVSRGASEQMFDSFQTPFEEPLPLEQAPPMPELREEFPQETDTMEEFTEENARVSADENTLIDQSASEGLPEAPSTVPALSQSVVTPAVPERSPLEFEL